MHQHKKHHKNRMNKRLLTVFILMAVLTGLFIQSRLARSSEDKMTGDVSSQKIHNDPEMHQAAAASEVISQSSEKAPDASAWNLTLVNSTHPLKESFSVQTALLNNGHAVDSRMYQPLKDMLDAAAADGLSPLVCSAYRTKNVQTNLYQNQVSLYLNRGYSREEAQKQAAMWVALPGTSEHQLGLAVDIVSESYQMLDEAQENTPEQKWLMEHCAKFGFILRYPNDKSHLTGIGYEPWHYRYVGKEAAKEIMDRGICLEEYLNPDLEK